MDELARKRLLRRLRENAQASSEKSSCSQATCVSTLFLTEVAPLENEYENARIP